ncbi:MAG: DUF6538 domain-containing protein [Hyphomicrobiales bacterium]
MGRRSRLSSVKGVFKHPKSSVFWFRRVVPEDLRSAKHIGMREIKFTLNTSDLRQAEALAAVHWQKWNSEFDDLRNGRKPSGVIPTDDDLVRLAREWRDLWHEVDKLEDEREIEVGSKWNSLGKLEFETRPMTSEEKKDSRKQRLVEHEENMYSGDTSLTKMNAHSILKESNEKFSTDESVVNRFLPILLEAEYDAFLIQRNRILGESSRTLLDRNPMEWVSKSMTLSQMLESYIESKRPRAQTESEWRTVFDRLIQVIGDKPVRQVTKHDVTKFIDKAKQIPGRARPAVKQLSVDQMIAVAQRENLKPISNETIRKHVTAVRSVFSWAVGRDYVTKNPASNLAPKREPSAPKRISFTQDDLIAIFEPKAYAKYSRHDADYWIPIVCLYTGARIEEIAQLHIADIYYDQNIPIIEISPNDSVNNQVDAKRVKNQSSVRKVPLHNDLMKLGFMEFVNSRRDQKSARLFYELKRNTNNRLSSSVGQRFSNHLKNVGIDDRRKVFHSFRHTFKDKCRNAGIYEDVHDRLTGHSNSSIGRGYGQGHDLQVLSREINRIDFAALLIT